MNLCLHINNFFKWVKWLIFCLFTCSRDISLLITFYNSAYQITVWRPTNSYSATTDQPSKWFCQKRGRDKQISWTTPSMKIKTWLKWNHNSCPRWIEPRNPIDENPKKFKDLKIIVLHYTTIATIKKTNYKKTH